MSDWSDGYVSEISYTYGYYPELNPQRIKLAFLSAGLAYPEVGTACELGFGQGVGANVHAAASMVSWHGTDFNPAQAAFAQELASVAGSGATLLDEGFEQFCLREDLPQFDFIGLHGIWSWISDENRGILVDFFRRRLKVGGVLYVSYNTQPGWAAMAPMRDLLELHSTVMGTKGAGIIPRVEGALEFAEKLLATNPGYHRANPQVAERIKRLKGMSKTYLAHEYFNRDWVPMSFRMAADLLAPAKLTFACSAHYLDHLDLINFTPEQHALLQEVPDTMFRQTVRDFLTNQQFRRDYWVKGARALSLVEQIDHLRKLRIILAIPRENVQLKVSGPAGEATLSPAVYDPVLDLLADHKPRTLGEIEQALRDMKIPLAQIRQVAVVMSGIGVLAVVQDDDVINKAKVKTDKLNCHLLARTRGSTEITVLCSPVTGGGIGVSPIHQLIMLARAEGRTRPGDIAAFVWQYLEMQKQRLQKNGEPLQTMEENLEELLNHIKEFDRKQMPVLKALQIV